MNNNKYNVSKNVGSIIIIFFFFFIFASNQAARYKIARLYYGILGK